MIESWIRDWGGYLRDCPNGGQTLPSWVSRHVGLARQTKEQWQIMWHAHSSERLGLQRWDKAGLHAVPHTVLWLSRTPKASTQWGRVHVLSTSGLGRKMILTDTQLCLVLTWNPTSIQYIH